MDETEESGFVIRDKRGQSRETPASESGQDAASFSATTASPPPSPLPDEGHAKAGPPLSFASFIFSLGTSALMLMGEQLSPDQSSTAFNLPQAKEIIDILSLLEDKTKGNLTEDEITVLRDVLYSLRMKYVGLASGQPPSA